MSVTHLDAEMRLRKQFADLSDSQGFAKLMQTRRDFDAKERERSYVAAYARNHKPEPPSAA